AHATRGVDTLIKSVEDNGIGRNANIYAELGSTWRFVMRDPTTAAHLLGKLLKHIGEDNVLWGTDSIWYGSPQDQIQAFRSFHINPVLAEAHGYPELTPVLNRRCSASMAHGSTVSTCRSAGGRRTPIRSERAKPPTVRPPIRRSRPTDPRLMPSMTR